MSNKIGVDVEVGTSGLENDLKKVTQAAGHAGKSMEEAFSGISTRRIRAQARALKELADEYRRLNDTFGKMEKSGTFGGLGLGRSGRGFSRTQYGSIAGMLGGAFGSLMSGGGIASTTGNLFGSLAGRGIGSAFASPGIGFAAGTILSKTLGAIGSRIDKGMTTAQNNLIETSVLRHSIGSAANDFNLLSASIKSASDNVGGLLDSETIKLFKSVSKASGATNIGRLYSDSLVAGQYSKAMGTDLSATGSFFGTMRSLGISTNDQSSRRIGTIIGEAIGKTGAFAKADEMMSAVSNFASISTRTTLMAQPRAMEGYAGLLSTMASGSIKDISGIASIIAQADASFRAGGGMGEASWNARLASYQQGYSSRINGLDVQYLNEMGMMGHASDVFGKNSKFYQFGTSREKARYDAIMADMRKRGTLGKSNFDVVLQNLQRQTGGGYLMASSLANDFRITSSQAISLIGAHRQYGGTAGLGNELSKRGLKGLSPDQVIRASAFLNADRNTLNEGADALLSGVGYNNALTAGQRKQLEAARNGGNDETLRELVLQFTATRTWEKDQGKATETAIKGMDNTVSRMSEKLVGAMNEARDAVLIMAGKNPEDFNQIREKWVQDQIDRANEVKNGRPDSNYAFSGSSKLLGAGHRVTDDLAKFARIASEGLGGGKERFIAAQLALETGYGHKTIGRYNFGNMKAGKDWKGDIVERMVKEYDASGRPHAVMARLKSYRTVDEAANDYIANVKRKWSGVTDAQSAHDWGKALQANPRLMYATDPGYPEKLQKVSDRLDWPDDKIPEMPKTASSPNNNKDTVNVQFMGDFKLLDTLGRTIGELSDFNTVVGKPRIGW